MGRRQTQIELDDARSTALDERAAASGRARGDLIRDAIDPWLASGNAAAIDRATCDGYARHLPSRDRRAEHLARESIGDESW